MVSLPQVSMGKVDYPSFISSKEKMKGGGVGLVLISLSFDTFVNMWHSVVTPGLFLIEYDANNWPLVWRLCRGLWPTLKHWGEQPTFSIFCFVPFNLDYSLEATKCRALLPLKKCSDTFNETVSRVRRGQRLQIDKCFYVSIRRGMSNKSHLKGLKEKEGDSLVLPAHCRFGSSKNFQENWAAFKINLSSIIAVVCFDCFIVL